ncbi:uncharacterized protein BT62DRAFT_930756, partial [Guyanagaster necrorhizus]
MVRMSTALCLQFCPGCMGCTASVESKAEDVYHIANNGRKGTALPLCILVFIGGEAGEAGGLS